MEKKWINIYTFFDILEGGELESILKENNIPANLISRQDSAFDEIFKHSYGEGIIQVREDDVKKAKKIADDFKKRREAITKATKEESRKYKAEIRTGVGQKNKSLYSTITIISIIILVGLIAFIAKNFFMLEGISNYKELINKSKEAIRINPNDAVAYENLGYVFSQLGYYGRAASYYKKAIKIKPDSIRYSGLGSSYLAAGNFKEAILALKRAVELNSKDELNYINLGKAHSKTGEYKLVLCKFNS